MYGSVHWYIELVSAIQYSRADDSHERLQIHGSLEFKAFDIVVIAASAGGISALGALLSGLPACFPAPVVIAQHLSSRTIYESCLDRVLERHTALKVKWAEDGERPIAGTVYLSPQDRLTVIDSSCGTLCTTRKSELQRTTPKANPLFQSAAAFCGARTLALVLSGVLDDGAEGATNVVEAGGMLLVQSYRSAEFDNMPKAAIKSRRVALAFDPQALAHAVVALVMAPGASDWFRVGDQRNLIMER